MLRGVELDYRRRVDDLESSVAAFEDMPAILIAQLSLEGDALNGVAKARAVIDRIVNKMSQHEATRPVGQSLSTLDQYVDNVLLSESGQTWPNHRKDEGLRDPARSDGKHPPIPK